MKKIFLQKKIITLAHSENPKSAKIHHFSATVGQKYPKIVHKIYYNPLISSEILRKFALWADFSKKHCDYRKKYAKFG
jgi:hypothetical protein